jgi:hypothetical protein
MTVAASATFSRAMREFLLAKLPAQVVTRNAARAALLITPAAGPFVVPASASLSISLDGSAFTAAPLTSGSRTAAQVAADIEAVVPGIASALTDGRLKLLATAAPSSPVTVSALHLAADATGANEALGFDPGGESCVRAPLVTPTSKGVCDGLPLLMEPYATGRMVVVLGDRGDVEVEAGTRRNERFATLAMRVYVPMLMQGYHQSREEIQSACECINDALGTTEGQYLGHSVDGTTVTSVLKVRCKSIKVSGSPWVDKQQANFLCDVADLVFTSLVHQRPSAA